MESHLQAVVGYFSTHPHLALGAVFAAALLEALALIGTVVPGSTVVFAGGVLIGLGALNAWLTAAVAIAGAILGDGISYWLGRHYHERIRAMWPMKSYPRVFERGEAYFASNGGKSVFVGRFLGPVRAIVPVVAGMSSMPAAQFYVMNVLSAFAWAAVHLLPGVLFGASLQLAGAVSSRLALLLVALVAAVWAISKLVRFVFDHGWPRVQALRDRVVAQATNRRGWLARSVLSLFDPARPESAALLTAAVLLLGSAWLFLGILEDVVSNDPLVQLDQTVFNVLQGLRTGWADEVMITITGLGGAAGNVPVIVAVSLLLAFKRYWRTLGYWLAAVGFGQIFVWLLKYTLGRVRPHNIYTGFEQFSFPSGHAASSIVVYGFLTFLLARGKSAGAKAAITIIAAIAILLISFSRLYLGMHWFSDVAASLSLGLAWVALLGIAYTHHVHNEPVRAWPLSMVALTSLALVGGTYVSQHHSADLKRYYYRPTLAPIQLSEWRTGGWRSLPAGRSELAGEIAEPFSVQWAASAATIAKTLGAAGWQAPRAWDLRTGLLWLLPHTPVEQLPVLPKFNRGEAQTLTFVKVVNPRERIVVRLWPLRDVPDGVATGQPLSLWIGTVTDERLRRPAGMVTVAVTESDLVTATRVLEQDLRSQRLPMENQARDGVRVLLIW